MAEDGQRPWGHYVVLADEPDHKVKRIVVNPGARLSLQYHHQRAEHWSIVSGRGVVTVNDREIPVSAGSDVEIPLKAHHRVANPGDEPLVFIEIQRGGYFGEDDIVRLQDDYQRVPE